MPSQPFTVATFGESSAENAPSVSSWAGLQITVRGGSQRRRTYVVEATGPLDYYSASLLRATYQRFRNDAARTGLRRLVLDLHGVVRFDLTGVAALLEIVRDAEQGRFGLFIADKASRSVYAATGLDERLRFLTPHQVEAL